MKKLILSLFVLLCMSTFAIAQDRTVSGTVTSQGDNLPIPGVSVKIVGAAGGAITGSDGKYSVNVPSGATALQFSFIGYTTENRPINSSGVINVALVNCLVNNSANIDHFDSLFYITYLDLRQE